MSPTDAKEKIAMKLLSQKPKAAFIIGFMWILMIGSAALAADEPAKQPETTVPAEQPTGTQSP
jgi:hypothetical protein